MHWFSAVYLAACFMTFSKVFRATLGAVLTSCVCGNIHILNLKLFTVTHWVFRQWLDLRWGYLHEDLPIRTASIPKATSPTPVDDDVTPYCIIMFCFMLNTIKLMYTARVELTYSFNSLNDLKLIQLQCNTVIGSVQPWRGCCVIKNVSLFCVICLCSHWCHF